MKIVIEQNKMAEEAEQTTYQAPFPLTVKCRKCKEPMTLMMLVDDEDSLLVEQRPKNVRVWMHDASVTALYLCTNCGSMRVMWNQA